MRNQFLGQVSLKRPWEGGPSLGSSSKRLGQTNCCTVKGPGGNQVKRCYNEGCGLNWVSPEGIYPETPPCAADGRPASCTPPPPPAQPAGGPIPTQPLQQAPGPTQVPLTNMYNGDSSFTEAQQPTGAYPGDPFRAVAPQTPIQAMPLPQQSKMQQVPYSPQTAPVQQPQAPAPTSQAPAMPEPCPEGAQPLERWAYACAMAHRT